MPELGWGEVRQWQGSRVEWRALHLSWRSQHSERTKPNVKPRQSITVQTA